jgi:ribokinase
LDLHRFLQGENLNLDHLQFTEDVPSGTALITVNAASENTIVVVSGSNFALHPADITAVRIQAGDIVVSVFEIPQTTIKALFEKAKQAGARTLLNPAPAAQFMDGLRELCDYIVVNETELAFFAGSESIPESHEQIKSLAEDFRSHPGQTIVVTLGSKGAVCLTDESFVSISGRQVKAVDTTGAGDCFVGALAAALAEGRGLMDAIGFANAAASLSVQKLGASDSLPYREQVMAVIDSH